MSYLLEILGRGLLAEVAPAFRHVFAEAIVDEADDARTHHGPNRTDQAVRRPRGLRLLAAGDYRGAQEALAAAVERSPSDRAARLGLACALDSLGLRTEAAEQLQLTLGHGHQDGVTWLALGICQEKLGDAVAAARSYRRALKHVPQLRSARERLAAMALGQNELDGAIGHYEQICWVSPGDLGSNLSLANLYLCAGRFAEAARRYEYVIALEPDNWEVQDESLGRLVTARRHEEALASLQGLIREEPENAEAHVRLGDVYAGAGCQHDALRAYARAVSISPEVMESMVKFGLAASSAGRSAQAVAALARAMEINDRILTGFAGLCVAQAGMKQLDEARATLDLAAEIEPNVELLFSELLRVESKHVPLDGAVGRGFPRTRQPVEQCAARPAGDGNPMAAGRAERLEADGCVAGYAERLRAVVRKRPDRADLHYRLGLLERYGGDVESAMRSFGRALAISPDYFKARIRLAFCLHRVGRMRGALAALRAAFQVDPSSLTMHYRLAVRYSGTPTDMALERLGEGVGRASRRGDDGANIRLALENMGLVEWRVAGWEAACAEGG